MGWIGAGLGYLCGNTLGGPIGGIIGAVIGNMIQERQKEKAHTSRPERRRPEGGGSTRRNASREQELLFLAAAAAMMAKLAKADGHITMSEIESAENAFRRLGLTAEKREYCIRAFRQAKLDDKTIYEYAQAFAAAQPDRDIREVFYDILWELACADGVLTAEEIDILRRITVHLQIRAFLFTYEYARHAVGAGADGGGSSRSGGGSSGGRRRPASAASSLDEAYATLGCTASSTDAELKKAYREKAKKYHPDELQARGVSPELCAKATEQMARINAAWAEVKKARGI